MENYRCQVPCPVLGYSNETAKVPTLRGRVCVCVCVCVCVYVCVGIKKNKIMVNGMKINGILEQREQGGYFRWHG